MPKGKYHRVLRIPAAPIVQAIDYAAARLTGVLSTQENDPGKVIICERAGINERLLFRWRSGETPAIEFNQADRIIVGLDKLWFDVYNEDTVRKPALEVRVYYYRQKHGKRYRCLRRIVRYGDLGTDYVELERVRVAFEGEVFGLAA